MNLFKPDRLIAFPADDPLLVKQLQNGTKSYLAKQAIIDMPTAGHLPKWRC